MSPLLSNIVTHDLRILYTVFYISRIANHGGRRLAQIRKQVNFAVAGRGISKHPK